MSHEIENLDVVGLKSKQAWHGLGVVIDENICAVQAAEKFGLTWPVEQYQLEAIAPDGSRHAINSHVANFRTADQNGNSIEHLLGVVGADYQVCQNRELAEFTDALAQTGDVTIESCGSIRNGKRVWFLARGEAFDVGTGDDAVYPYILVSNGHDGGQAIRVTPTTVRVVCSNTLHMVIPRSEGERADQAAISIRHSGKIAGKLDEARKALRYYGNVLAKNREVYDAMAATKMDRDSAMRLFADNYAANWEIATPGDLSSSNEKTRKTAAHRAKRMQAGANLFLKRYEQEAKRTGLSDNVWAYFNALTGYIQHDRNARGKDDADRVGRRIESNLFGVNSSRTSEALASAMAVVG